MGGSRYAGGGGGGGRIAIKKYKSPDLSRNYFREVEVEARILDQLDHQHVVTLLGVFKRENIVGVLLAEVAVCDLEDFLDSFIEAAEMTPGLWGAFEFGAEARGRGDEERHQHGGDTSAGSSFSSEREEGDRDGARERRERREAREAEAEKAHAWLLSHVACLLHAVEYIHALHISHNDLRAPNVLLTPTRLLLCDFGCSEDLKLHPPPTPASWRSGSGLGLALLQIETEKALAKRLEKDVLMLSTIFLEMALARDYELRAVQVQDWEGMWRERGGEGLRAWAREGLGVGRGRRRWKGDEGAEGVMLRVVEAVGGLFARGDLSAEGVRGWMKGDEGVRAFLTRGCCAGEESGGDDGGDVYGRGGSGED